MDKIEKLLRKISRQDRKRLLDLIQALISNKRGLDLNKVVNTDFFRLKTGGFRIIFHYENNKIIIDAIKLRSENTYKNL